MDLRRVELEARREDVEWLAMTTERRQCDRLANGLFPQPLRPLEGFSGTRHALLGELGRKDPCTGGAGCRAPLPHGQLPHPRGPQGQVGDHGERDRLAHGLSVKSQDFPRAARSPDHTEDPLVPPAVPGDHLVGQATENLIRQDDGGDDCPPIASHRVRQGQDRRDHIARVATPW